LGGLSVQNDEPATEKEAARNWQKMLKLQGAREDDPDKIAQWLDREFLNAAS
jgi:hypothetical protein